MTRVLISYDELRKSYKLVTGYMRANIHAKKNDMFRIAGQNIILDKETPIRYTENLELGLIKSDCKIKITAIDGFDKNISKEEAALIENLFNDGSYLIRTAYESFVSQIKTNMVDKKYEPLFLNNLIINVFPKITKTIQDEINSALGKISGVFNIEINANTNISSAVDQYAEKESDRRDQITRQIFEMLSNSPYPPDTYPDTIKELVGAFDQLNPSLIAPTQEDVKQANNIIDQHRRMYKKQLLLGNSQSNQLSSGKK